MVSCASGGDVAVLLLCERENRAITDAMQAAGMPDGRYTLCGEKCRCTVALSVPRPVGWRAVAVC